MRIAEIPSVKVLYLVYNCNIMTVIAYWVLSLIALASSSEKETEWMLRISNGEKKAMKLLYNKYKNLLYGLIIAILKDRREAEDCLQEVFTQAWQKADHFDPERGKVYSFMVTMARNKAIDRTRSRAYKDAGKENPIDDGDFKLTLEGDFNNPREDLELSERAAIIRKALASLREEERKVLYVAYFNGMTQSEISEKLDIPLGTVKYRMRQGMIKLRDMLDPGEL